MDFFIVVVTHSRTMKTWVWIFVLVITLKIADLQIVSLDCPHDWILLKTNCYLFSDVKVVFEEADAACWSKGANLISVETAQEHLFVSDWLKRTNTFARNIIYFTSGKYMKASQTSQSHIYWEATHQVHVGPTFWVGVPPNGGRTYRIAYIYADGEYKWTNITSQYIGGYICEIPKSELQAAHILQRDFEYGHEAYDPTKVKRGPVILQQPSNIIVFETVTTVHIECLANGNPAPNYTIWRGLSFQNATEVLPSKRYTLTGGAMTIQDPEEKADANTYFLKISNDVGTVISEMAYISFGYLGSFPNIELDPVIATAFKGVKMECNQPSFSPRVTFHWFKNSATGIHVWEGAANFFVSYSGTMYISEVQPTDAQKKYFCVVSLAPPDNAIMGEGLVPSRASLGQWIYLSDETGSSDNDYAPIIHTHVFPVNPMVGTRVRTECLAYGRLPLTYSWSRDDNRPFVKGTALADRNRVLYINNAPIDAEGNYICKVRTGSGMVASKTIVLIMNAKPYFPYPIKDILADPGMKFKWFCKAVARPEAYYTWYKNGKLLTSVPGRINIEGGVLTFLKIDASRDEGMYQCAATNAFGTTFSTGQLKVLSIKPNFNRYPFKETTYAAIGSNMTITCTVQAAPLPDVQWLKNGANMNLVAGQLNGRIGMNIEYGLVIAAVEFSDAGTYTCTATNVLGEASNSTGLVVADLITFIRPPEPTTSMVNTTTFISCEAAYNPIYDIAYLWKFNGQPIDFASSVDYVLGLNFDVNGMYIRQTQFKHAGMYECTVRSPIHSASMSALISVEGPPFAPAGVYVDEESITHRSVVIVWTIVEHHQMGGIATGYDIEADTTLEPEKWITVAQDIPDPAAAFTASTMGTRIDQRAYNVTDLMPDTSYRFRIRSLNQFGRGQEPSIPSAIVKLSASAPVKAPENVFGGGGTEGTLTITWDILDISEHCGPGLGYFVYWKDERDTKDWKKELGTDNMALKEGKYVVTVGVDNYYLPYKVKVGTFNDLGTGPNSTEATIYSAEGMPQAVPVALDVEGYNGTSIIVYWKPIPSTREAIFGKVSGYRVTYYANLHGETPFQGHEPDPIVNEILFKDVYGQTDHCQLIGLHMNSEYFSRVQVFNGAGFGPKGEWRRSETANDMLRDHPIYVAVYHRDSHSVLVRWRGITHYTYSESSLQGYKVRVWKVQEDIRTAVDTIADQENEAIVEGLQTKEVYVLRVVGFSVSGYGSLSEAVYFTITDSDIINIALDPATSQMCFSSEDGRTCGSVNLVMSQTVLITAVAAALTTIFQLLL